jgi:hypothetical protein
VFERSYTRALESAHRSRSGPPVRGRTTWCISPKGATPDGSAVCFRLRSHVLADRIPALPPQPGLDLPVLQAPSGRRWACIRIRAAARRSHGNATAIARSASLVRGSCALARADAGPSHHPDQECRQVWFDGKDVYLHLPESDCAGGTATLARIREPLSQFLSQEELDGITFAAFAPMSALRAVPRSLRFTEP